MRVPSPPAPGCARCMSLSPRGGRAPSPSSLTSLSPAEERAASAEALEAQLLLSADLTLRAGQDGATVLVHRGVLCVHSRVFSELLNATPADDIALSGRTKADLELLVSWLYRCENITQDNVSQMCALADEYDMPRMMATAEDWLVDAAARGGVLQLHAYEYSRVEAELRAESVDAFVRVISLARLYKLRRFADAAKRCVDQLSREDLQLVLKRELTEAVE